MPIRSKSPLVFLLLGALALSAAAIAERVSPPTSAATATTESLGALARTDGFCLALSTAAVDVWQTAPALARLDAAERRSVRFVELANADTSANVCALLGTETADGLTCADDANTVGRVLPSSSRQWTVARDPQAGEPPALWVVAASGTPTACVTVGW